MKATSCRTGDTPGLGSRRLLLHVGLSEQSSCTSGANEVKVVGRLIRELIGWIIEAKASGFCSEVFDLAVGVETLVVGVFFW